MSRVPFIRRVVLQNYKSIGHCDVCLRPLTYLVGQNGAGKSNFMDALHFVRDALSNSLDYAFNQRGGLSEVRRRSSGHPTHFGIRLEFNLADGRDGHYTFIVGSLAGGGYEVQKEECIISGVGKGPFFRVAKGKLRDSSENTFPSVTADRLALVAVSGLTAFRPVFDALTAMGFYNLNPKLMRELQKPQDGRLLRPAGENVASVIGHLERVAPENMQTIQEYLHTVAPMVHGLERKPIGPMETLEIRQEMAGAKHPWRFLAQNMSDGTLRALGVLTALLQGNVDYSPTLIAIARKHFAQGPSVTYTEGDAARYLESEADPARFTKALLYGSISYFPRDGAQTLLRILRRRFTRLSRFVGNVADVAFARDFFGDKYEAGIEDRPDSDIGVWWSHEAFAAMAARTGWNVEFGRMPDTFYASHYRFDAVLRPA